MSNNTEQLHQAYESYIKLLEDEIKDLVPFAALSGHWMPAENRFKQGDELREKIVEYKNQFKEVSEDELYKALDEMLLRCYIAIGHNAYYRIDLTKELHEKYIKLLQSKGKEVKE